MIFVRSEDKTLYNTVFKKLLDIGDFIGVKGFVFITQMGEISIHVREITLLGKSLNRFPLSRRKTEWFMMQSLIRNSGTGNGMLTWW